ncbi:hypothetical protein AK812_SmicGene1810 [Symbiodinium microadriaticum]|uniref:C3H1-type domain-containing protein n=1 Tax=Symbiodinium microadriaticum TaxID=2951 RepID=A0A1Q9F2Z7_SYMMI|nr:hypothetical protein AK812_SmicGene1810 [Symbiodinium microadriaticum]
MFQPRPAATSTTFYATPARPCLQVPSTPSNMMSFPAPNYSPSRAQVVLGSPALPSLGSGGHATHECKPCVFFHKKEGCASGRTCLFCHLCDESEKRRRQRQRRRRLAEIFLASAKYDARMGVNLTHRFSGLSSMAKQPFEEVPAGLQALWRQAASTLSEATCKASDLLMVANDASPRADQLLHSMLQSWNRQLLALQPGGSAILPLAWPGDGGRQAALAVLRRTSAEEGRLAVVNLGGSGSEYHLQELQGPPSWPLRCTAPVVVAPVPWSLELGE